MVLLKDKEKDKKRLISSLMTNQTDDENLRNSCRSSPTIRSKLRKKVLMKHFRQKVHLQYHFLNDDWHDNNNSDNMINKPIYLQK